MSDTEPALRVVLAHADRRRRELLADALAGPEIEVVFKTGTTLLAVRVARDLVPDAVIIGARMPDLNGLAALPLIRTAAPGASVALVTPGGEREGHSLTPAAINRGFDLCCPDDDPALLLALLLDRLAAHRREPVGFTRHG